MLTCFLCSVFRWVVSMEIGCFCLFMPVFCRKSLFYCHFFLGMAEVGHLPGPLSFTFSHNFIYKKFRNIYHWSTEMICNACTDLMKNSKQHYKHILLILIVAHMWPAKQVKHFCLLLFSTYLKGPVKRKSFLRKNLQVRRKKRFGRNISGVF